MDLLHHISVFVDIADQGSMAAVARARSLTPSAVTATLQRLEEYLGTQLVLRSTRTLSLTSEGERFLTRSRAILNDLEEAVDQLSDTGPLRGSIRITSVNDFGRLFLAAQIDGFLALHPQVHIDVALGDGVVDLIADGYDLAIRTGPLADSQLTARALVHGGRSICAAPGYWQKYGRPQRPEDLIHHNCLVLSRMGNPQSVWQFQENGNQLPVHVSGNRTANDCGLLRQWAVLGAGVILKSDLDIRADIEAGRLETVLDEFKQIHVNVYVVHASGAHLSRRVKALIEYLVEQCSGLYEH